MSVLNKVAELVGTSRVSMDNVVEALKSDQGKALEVQIESQYRNYLKTTQAKNPKSIKAFINDLITRHNKQASQRESSSFKPESWIKIVDMMKLIEEVGTEKDIRFCRPIAARLSNNRMPSPAQMSVISQIWTRCVDRKKEMEERKSKGLIAIL